MDSYQFGGKNIPAKEFDQNIKGNTADESTIHTAAQSTRFVSMTALDNSPKLEFDMFWKKEQNMKKRKGNT
jgi:hypothetical protein